MNNLTPAQLQVFITNLFNPKNPCLYPPPATPFTTQQNLKFVVAALLKKPSSSPSNSDSGSFSTRSNSHSPPNFVPTPVGLSSLKVSQAQTLAPSLPNMFDGLFSCSPTPPTVGKIRAPRKNVVRRSPVWKFFLKNEGVESATCSFCQKVILTKNSR